MNEDERKQKIGKLPQWSQGYISKLERDVSHYKDLLTKTEAGQTSVKWTDYINEKYLPDRGLIRWYLSNGGRLEATLKGDKIEIRSPGSSSDGKLAIIPDFSNSLYITIIKETNDESSNL